MKKAYPTVALIVCALMAGACSKNATRPTEPGTGNDPAEVGSTPRSARVLPMPGQAAPTTGSTTQAPLIAWDVPEGWVEETPRSNMRRAQYRVPGAAGDGECIVYYFGPGQGGDAASNAVRWAGQFRQPDGRSSAELMQMSQLEGTQVPVQIVQLPGTYDGGMTMTDTPAESKENYMLLGGIAQGGDAPWFFKFTGPEETVRGQRESFVRMMESLRGSS
jgi:hypothetical protein